MAGSDWKRFLGHHRKSSNKDNIAQVNYDKLLSDIQAKKEQGKTSEDKMARIVSKASEQKEEKLLKEHRKAWSAMVPILEKELHKCQHELNMWLTNAMLMLTVVDSPDMKQFISEATTLQIQCSKQREQLAQDIQKDMRVLRTKVSAIKKLLQRKQDKQTHYECIEDIRHQISLTKCNHTKIEEQLAKEWVECTTGLEGIYNQFIHVNERGHQFIGGVPNAVWSWKCPSERLRQKMAEEFEEVDRHFTSQLVALENHYKKYSTSMSSWSDEDKIRFDLILAQYPMQLKNRRSLYIDRLIREFPRKARKEIVEYEEGSCAGEYYQNQRAVLIRSWYNAHSTLLDKVYQVYQDALKQWKLKDAMQTEAQQQKNLCEALSKKVMKWRKQLLELQEQAAKEQARKDAIQEETRKAEESKQKLKREVIKDKLMEYHVKKDRERETEENRRALLVEEFKMITNEELKRGKERTAFREQLLITKQEEMASIAAKMEEEKREKERQLEELRQLVRVEAPSDPRRAMMDTESSRARVLMNEDQLELQKPLFPVHSFTDQRILSDRRVKVSNALREAGLISTQYAQQILSNIPPPRPTRKDQKSSIFK